jgi:hypothetical protein
MINIFEHLGERGVIRSKLAIVLMRESKKHRGIFRRTENYSDFAPIRDVISLYAETDTILYQALSLRSIIHNFKSVRLIIGISLQPVVV